MYYAIVSVRKDLQEEECGFKYIKHAQLANEIYRLVCKHDLLETMYVIIVSNGYNGTYQILNGNGSGTKSQIIPFDKSNLPYFLKGMDHINITTSPIKFKKHIICI